ncbi:MAG TPA: hypothetical protein VK427_24095, partial [Kofleriaceae bacterium]|nr:hypothetical protein [Kofleriaceae bacterium]
PLSIAYMLFFDLPVGAMPISLANLSITYQMREVGDERLFPAGGSVTGVGLAMLGIVWLAIALWRFRRLEA